jgi:hypothetical protein
MTWAELLVASDPFWPAKLCAAIVAAYLVHEYIGMKIDGDDDPDGFA